MIIQKVNISDYEDDIRSVTKENINDLILEQNPWIELSDIEFYDSSSTIFYLKEDNFAFSANLLSSAINLLESTSILSSNSLC